MTLPSALDFSETPWALRQALFPLPVSQDGAGCLSAPQLPCL